MTRSIRPGENLKKSLTWYYKSEEHKEQAKILIGYGTDFRDICFAEMAIKAILWLFLIFSIDIILLIF